MMDIYDGLYNLALLSNGGEVDAHLDFTQSYLAFYFLSFFSIGSLFLSLTNRHEKHTLMHI